MKEAKTNRSLHKLMSIMAATLLLMTLSSLSTAYACTNFLVGKLIEIIKGAVFIKETDFQSLDRIERRFKLL